MTIYGFKCRECGNVEDSSNRSPRPCRCGGLLKRDYSTVSFGNVLHGHYNQSMGCYVNGKQGFSEALKRKSEEATLSTGIPHNFQEIDASDPKSVGATDEGLENSYRVRTDLGMIESKRRHF